MFRTNERQCEIERVSLPSKKCSPASFRAWGFNQRTEQIIGNYLGTPSFPSVTGMVGNREGGGGNEATTISLLSRFTPRPIPRLMYSRLIGAYNMYDISKHAHGIPPSSSLTFTATISFIASTSVLRPYLLPLVLCIVFTVIL